jgi:3-hydroxy acid dehydrogenase/malonic semialdehyde reductase
MKKTIFITGATSGIGKSCAEKFAAEGHDIVITGRRKDRLEDLEKSLKDQYGVAVYTLAFDVRNREECFASVGLLPDAVQQIDVLINNAGLAAGREALNEADIDDWDNMIQTNVNGLLYITRAVLPLIRKAKGHIINIGSVAGKVVYENGAVYCASKFAVDALTKGMRLDLVKFGIKVTSVNPGAVETEFSLVRFKGDKDKADAVYTGFLPLTAADIANTVFYCTTLPAHVCINDLSITPLQQADATTIYKNALIE